MKHKRLHIYWTKEERAAVQKAMPGVLLELAPAAVHSTQTKLGKDSMALLKLAEQRAKIMPNRIRSNGTSTIAAVLGKDWLLKARQGALGLMTKASNGQATERLVTQRVTSMRPVYQIDEPLVAAVARLEQRLLGLELQVARLADRRQP